MRSQITCTSLVATLSFVYVRSKNVGSCYKQPTGYPSSRVQVSECSRAKYNRRLICTWSSASRPSPLKLKLVEWNAKSSQMYLPWVSWKYQSEGMFLVFSTHDTPVCHCSEDGATVSDDRSELRDGTLAPAPALAPPGFAPAKKNRLRAKHNTFFRIWYALSRRLLGSLYAKSAPNCSSKPRSLKKWGKLL